MEFIEASNPEWCHMWEELGKDSLNHGDPICLFMGACWEYMGSTHDHHNFRHLKHPSNGGRQFVYIERVKGRLAWAS